MSGLEFSPGNTRYTVCGSTVCLLAVVVGFTKEGNSVWCAGHQLIVVVLLLHLRVCRVKSCGLADVRGECGAQFLAVDQTGYKMGIP